MLIALTLAFAFPSKFVAVDRLLIGQLKGKVWSTVPDSAKSTQWLTLTKLNLDRAQGTVKVKGLGLNDAVGGVFLNSESLSDTVLTYGIKPSWPRPVKVLDNNAKGSLDVLAAFLTSKGTKTAPHLSAAYSVDLDGDGTTETLLVGQRAGYDRDSTSDPKEGDYSVVLLVAAGKTSALYFGNKPQMGLDFGRIRAIADLDGDGRMEVVISHDYYEGQAAAVFSFRAGKLKKLCEVGAGV